MFKLVYAEQSETSHNVVHLLSRTPPPRGIAANKLLKAVRTRVAIQSAMKSVGAPSTYALESFVAKQRGFNFDNLDRSRTFEDLYRRGSPAIDDYESWLIATPGKGEAVQEYFNSPRAAKRNAAILEVGWALQNIEGIWGALRHPIWELLRVQLPSTKRLDQAPQPIAQGLSFPGAGGFTSVRRTCSACLPHAVGRNGSPFR